MLLRRHGSSPTFVLSLSLINIHSSEKENLCNRLLYLCPFITSIDSSTPVEFLLWRKIASRGDIENQHLGLKATIESKTQTTMERIHEFTDNPRRPSLHQPQRCSQSSNLRMITVSFFIYIITAVIITQFLSFSTITDGVFSHI